MIICLIGPSAAGKSTIAKRLQSLHPERFARVPVDFFFVPRPPQVSMPDYLSAPFAYDWDAVDQTLNEVGTRRSTPDCDFDQLVWRSERGGLPIAEAPAYVLDGMRPHPRCDYLVMLDLDPAVQRQRLIARDLRWGTQVAERSSHLAATFEAGCAELPRKPDLRLSAAAEVEHNANKIISALESRGVAEVRSGDGAQG